MFREPSSNEIRITRVYDAPVRAVWDAWTDLEQVSKWWGPRGFTLTTHSKDLRPGGTWRYTMHGPDGVDYPNIATYYLVEPCAKLVYDHGATETTPPLFRVTVTFKETNGKTTMDMVSTLPTPEAAREIMKFIKQAGGTGTWDRLAEHLVEQAGGAPCFVIARSFEAPPERVFAMWVEPEHLARWLPPAGASLRFIRANIAEGESSFFVITSDQGAMHVRADYLVVEPPHRLVYDQQFVDEAEQPVAEHGGGAWPSVLRTTVLLMEEAPGRTRVRVTMEPQGSTTAAELGAFLAERAGMTLGWSGSFDALDAVLGTGA
jgi:uncharacterized protein YndB with AHSA1/START domain